MRRLMLVLLVVTSGLCLGEEPIRVNVKLVNVAFSARDARGALVNTLTKDDVEVLEDAVPQKVSFFARSVDVPLTLGLIVDFSGSQDQFSKQHQHALEAVSYTHLDVYKRQLEDFVLFDGLRARFKLESWNRWPRELAHRNPLAIEKVRAEMLDELDIRRAVQFFFYEQWQALRAYCAQHSIRVVGDIAIFVNFDGADVWTHPELFRLNSELDPEVVAGVPPEDVYKRQGS